MCKQAQEAAALFFQGFNCAQSVIGAFDEDIGIDRRTLTRISSGFGGGVAGMKEICGAVSGMMMAAGYIFGSGENVGAEEKNALKMRLSTLADDFKNEFGCIRCKDLLAQKDDSIPQREYCSALVHKAAEIMAGGLAGASEKTRDNL